MPTSANPRILRSLPERTHLRGMGMALALGIAGGMVASTIGLPLPWMLGPMLACGSAALAGAPLHGPTGLRPLVIPIIGVMLGASFHPDMIAALPGWGVSFALLPVYVLVAGGLSFLMYRRVGGYDPVTAFFSAAPGGLNEMVVLGGEAGGDERRIALAHAVRVFLVISIVAIGFALFAGVRAERDPGSSVGFVDVGLWEGALLTLCAVLGVPLARRLRLPAATLFGPMFLSALAHLTQVVHLPPPTVLVTLAQLVIGTILGCRFAGAKLAEFGKDLLLGFGATLMLLATTLGLAIASVVLGPAPFSQAVLAYSPGGLTEMSLLALALNQDVAFVAAAHVARIVVVLAITPYVFSIIARWISAKEAFKPRE